MKKLYAIIFNSITESSEMEIFEETIRSNYVSKRAKENVFFIIAENSNSREVFDNVHSKLDSKPSIMIVRLDEFYGSFGDGAVAWVHEKFPELPWEE